ncbi:1-phosphatidylinositol 4,5-bisphosphate phosphodiesterase zeta-1 [Vanrija pseudolonga]|uniref:Phosphoinositide phospholipase C n=1 Tax=Vanrija pseudolonga TaxID=143232 RepID=A0AAF0YCM6_9TREE|nr:1-phosphatidylinositol 4,5-bisphosphate phosphodiesterase zeta-1 [Vanrija pseudolonga]
MGITSKLAALSPFGHKEHGDDEGEAFDPTSVAGGGLGHSQESDAQLRVSQRLRKFIADNGILDTEHAGVGSDDTPQALRDLVSRPHFRVPPAVIDRSHPLTDYYMSSSHNTYLLAHQLYGTSCPTGYEMALKTGARCVEIDAWDNSADQDEPKVTHGFTLVSSISFRSVCETIRDVVDAEQAEYEKNPHDRPAPIFLSLENHCGAHGQQRLVDIMNEVWGDRLLGAAARAKGHQEEIDDSVRVRLDELESKICVMVEYHFDDEPDGEDGDEGGDEDAGADPDADADQAKAYDAQKKAAAAKAKAIIPALASIGVYAQSVKPPNNSWFESSLDKAPHNHLINISESALGAHLPAQASKIANHNAQHLMRVYPRGTRIRSSNLRPVPFWGIGAQVCALNWQRFGVNMQLNHAMFAGTDGYVLKPAYLRGNPIPALPTGRRRLRLRVAGASDAPPFTAPYVSCVLIHPNDLKNDPPKRKTGKDREENVDPMWDETLEWEYDESELVFLRILLKSDEKMARNPVLTATTLRLLYAVPGWSFMRMWDLGGHLTKTSLLVHIDIEEI